MYGDQKEVDVDHEEVMFSSKLSFLDLSVLYFVGKQEKVKRG